MSLDACLCRGICVRPPSMLIVAKQDAESGMFGILLCDEGVLLMCLLTGDRSVTKSIWPPDFGTKKAWQHHLCGPVTLVILPWVMRSSMEPLLWIGTDVEFAF